MKNSLLTAFRNNWRTKGFPQEGTILLAVSGGADSMALAHLCKESGISIAIAHVNYRLRGAESDEEEALVRQWALERNISFHVLHPDIEEAMQAAKMGLQEAARAIRYEWFGAVLREHRYRALATAHHAEDHAETVLINLLKGTGAKGLAGIPEQAGSIFRPLLFARKAELTAYITEYEIPYRDDSSNAGDKYLRNRIRHHILPALASEFRDPVAAIAATAGNITGAVHYGSEALKKLIRRNTILRGKDLYIPIRWLIKQAHPKAILFEALAPFGFEAAQMGAVLALAGSDSGKQIHAQTHIVLRNREHLIVTSRQPASTDFITIDTLPFSVETPEGTFHFSASDAPAVISPDLNIAILNRESAPLPLILRRPRTGDYLYPFGMKLKKKKVSRLLIDLKIPVHRKAQLWILESGGRILWVAGIRLDERARVKPGAAAVLEVRFIPG